MLFINSKKIIPPGSSTIICLCLGIMAIYHPTHFMADDWEWIYAFKTNNLTEYTRHLYHRFILHGLSIRYVFFLFLPFSLVLGKFVTWGLLLLASYFYLITFAPQLVLTLKTRWWCLPCFLFLLAFPPNNHESLFFPSVMTLLPIFTVLSLIFYVSHLGQIKGQAYWQIAGGVIAFYTYESLLVFYVLMECAYVFYHCPQSLICKLKQCASAVLPAILTCALLKILGHIIMLQAFRGEKIPLAYAAKWGFQWEQFYQLLQMSFLHDYYKIRWATGSFALVGVLLVAAGRLKVAGLKSFIQTEGILLLFYFLGTIYYYLIMDYSSRRALGGPLFFLWGLCSIAYVSLMLHSGISGLYKRALSFCFILPFLVHHGYIIHIKLQEEQILERNHQKIKATLAKANTADVPISMSMVSEGLVRGWNIVNPIQHHGYLKYYLTPAEYAKCLSFKDQYPNFTHIYKLTSSPP